MRWQKVRLTLRMMRRHVVASKQVGDTERSIIVISRRNSSSRVLSLARNSRELVDPGTEWTVART